MNDQPESSTETKKCTNCYEDIHLKARICKNCGSRQNPVLAFLQTFGLVLSTIVALISLYGFYGSTREAKNAEKSSQTAMQASKDSIEARRQADLAAASANRALLETAELRKISLQDKLDMLKEAIRSEKGVIDSSSTTMNSLYSSHGVAPGDRASISALPGVASQIDELAGIIRQRQDRVNDLKKQVDILREQIERSASN